MPQISLNLDLPVNLDAERYVLGAALTDQDAWLRISEVLTAGDFSLQKHRLIFARLGQLFDRGEALTASFLAQELHKHGQLESVDGLTYLVTLASIPALVNLEAFCRIVRDFSIRRKAMLASQDLLARCASETGAGDDLLAQAERVTEILSAPKTRRLDARTVEEVIADEGGVNAFLAPEARPGIHIPFPTIHETLGGLRHGKLVILGARPSIGKTAFASQCAEHAAENGNNVVIVSLEMSARDILYRSITGRAQVSAYRFRRGQLGQEDRHAVYAETGKLAQLGSRLRFVDKAETTIAGLNALLRSLDARNTLANLLIIDYIQLLSSVDATENRVQEVSAFSRGLKKIAQHFGIPVLALSQLSRKDEQTNAEPQLHWLRDSGSIEQDADQVAFLWRKKEPTEGQIATEIDWKCAKNRDGMLNRGVLTFHTKFCRFVEGSEAEEAA